MNHFFTRVIRYFFQGLLVVGPLGITIYVLYISIVSLDGLLRLEDYPGLGILLVLLGITLLGFLTSNVLSGPVLSFFERLIEKIPVVGLLYTSVKDLIGAFVGNKKKFNKPVAVVINKELNFKRLGFMTQESMETFGQKGLSAVYFPHSYNISGNVVLVPTALIEPLNIPSADVMKFVVSGGVSGIED